MELKSKLCKFGSFCKKNIFVFIFYFVLFGYFFLLLNQVSSLTLDWDIDEYILRADAFFHGDVFLHHYALTTETFLFTVNPWYFLAYLIFGISFESKILGSTFMFFSAIMCATILIPKKNQPVTLVDLLFFLFVAGFPRVETYWMPFGHITIFGIAFVIFYFFSKLLKNEHKILSTVMISVFLFMGILSDKITYPGIVFPMALLLIRQVFPIDKENKQRYKHLLYVGIVLTASVIVSSIARFLYTKYIVTIGGSNFYGYGIALKDFKEAVDFAPMFIESISRLYGINFLEGAWMVVVSIFQIFFIAIGLILIIYQGINFFIGKVRDYESELISMSLIAMMILTYSLKMADTVYAARYFCGMPMITSILIIRSRWLFIEQYNIKFFNREDKTTRFKQIGSKVLIGLCLVPLILGEVYFENKQIQPINGYFAAAQEMKDMGLQYGFTDGLTANEITVTNHKEVDLLHILRSDGKYIIAKWGVQEERKHYERNFVFLWYGHITVLNRDEVIESFGTPCKEILREEYAIMVYDYDIAQKVVEEL